MKIEEIKHKQNELIAEEIAEKVSSWFVHDWNCEHWEDVPFGMKESVYEIVLDILVNGIEI